MTDNELIQRIQLDDNQAFRYLFDRYAKRIYHFSKAYLSNHSDAEELVQDVFVKLWYKRHTIIGNQNIKAFIFKVAVNTVYDIVRKKKYDHLYNSLIEYDSYTSSETWNEVLYNDLEAHFNKLVEQLPDKRKEIFLLSRREGLSTKEIAEVLSISQRTVDSQIYKALAFLKKNLKQEMLWALFYYLFI